MLLYLVQHGEAKSKEEDPDRPLTEKGRADVLAVCEFAEQHARVRPRRILHSGKTRARETAELLAERVRPSGGAAKEEGLEPLADPATWEERLKENDEDLMLVGHLPHLSKLAARLLTGDAERQVVSFQQGGMLCLAREEADHWSIRWMVIPELVRKDRS